jgi:hypothetical protein
MSKTLNNLVGRLSGQSHMTAQEARIAENRAKGRVKIYPKSHGANERDETYEGWKNHETWSVALFVDNDYPAYQAKNAALASHGGKFTAATVEKFIRSRFPYGARGSFTSSIYRKVHWNELAEHWNSR